MTRKPLPLISILLRSASHRALCLGLEAALVTPSRTKTALGFLARLRIWLRLIFGGVTDDRFCLCAECCETVAPLNRTLRRRRRRALPLARRADRLADVIHRRFGHARYLQWLYNRTLTSRFRWCFTAWNWSWRPRSAFLCFSGDISAPPSSHVALHPD